MSIALIAMCSSLSILFINILQLVVAYKNGKKQWTLNVPKPQQPTISMKPVTGFVKEETTDGNGQQQIS